MILKFHRSIWSIQWFIILLVYRVSYFPTTIRRWYRNCVGVIPLFSSVFLSFKFETDRLHHCRVIDSATNVSKLRQISQTQIWDPGLSSFEIGDGGVNLRPYLFKKIRLLYSTVRGSFPSVLKRTTIFGEVGPLLFVAMVLVGDAIHSHGVFAKRRGSILYGGSDDDRKGIPHLSFGCIMGHIDTSKTERLVCITETIIQDATIPFAESIRTRSKDFTAEANLRVTEPHILRESLWQQLWERRQWILQYQHRESLLKSSDILISTRRQDTESFPITLNLNLLPNVMLGAFWSFSGKLIANDECVKGGLDRLHLLPISLLDSGVTSTLSSKLFQFPVFAYIELFGMFQYFVNTV